MAAWRSRLVLAAILAVFVPAVRAQAPDELAGLRKGHPRLYVLDSDLAAVRQAIQQDPLVRGWHEQLRTEAKKIPGEPPVERKLVGPRLLGESRRALYRISTLAGLYRLDGDKALAERARQEMLAAAAFTDWNPSHFLDVAEMTNALALGYDWLFDVLPEADRATIRRAIVDKGLKPGLDVYRKGRGWPLATHNWNQVCNGGLTAGALALADDEPALAAEVIRFARASIVRAMRSFAPDGGWNEGPGYWAYATQYNVFFLAGTQTALGTDFSLLKMPGVAQTGEFRMHSVAPTNLTFNFADAGEGAGSTPQMLWLAHAFSRPDYARHERQGVRKRPSIFHLLWSRPEDRTADTTAAPPRGALFRGVDVAFFRGSWDDPKTVWLGFKGGDNRANHSHLDLGTFVLDAQGRRWATDLGPDDYNLPGYFGKQRWTYYRLTTAAHNTLRLDNQDPAAKAPLIAYRSTPERAFAVADLSAAYPGKVAEWRRGVALLNRRQVLVQDEVRTERPVALTWGMLTPSTVTLHGDRAELTQPGGRLHARILEPAGAKFEVGPAAAPEPQKQQPNVRDLAVRLPEKAGAVRLVVVLTPGGEDDTPAPPVEPLAKWIDAGKLSPLPVPAKPK